MKKWIRGLIVGIVLNYLKNTSFVKKLVAKLKNRKTLVGRVGLGLFTALAGVKYYNPELPVDDGIEILGMIFSWLALEIGLDKSEVDEIVEEKQFDPSQPIDIAGVQLPSPESLGLAIDQFKKISSDEDKQE